MIKYYWRTAYKYSQKSSRRISIFGPHIIPINHKTNLKMLLLLFILFILWTLFGSFSTVLIERWHSWKWGIVLWRSECPQCNHTLGWMELIPIWSYIFQKWKCMNCKNTIPRFYPLAEILMWGIFMCMGYVFFLWTSEIFSWEMLLLLTLGFITGVNILYDFRYMEIPDQIMIPWIFGYFFLLLLSIPLANLETVFFDRYSFMSMSSLIVDHIYAALWLYTFFYLQILIPGSVYLIRKKQWKNFLLLLLWYFTFPFELLISPFQKENEKENEEPSEIPTWIGWGDLRVALFIGLTLGTIHGIASLFIAYILGSIVGIFLLVTKKNKSSQIAFWPFLGLGWIIAIVFYQDILNIIYWYNI